MAKTGGKNSTNLLRISGLLFAFAGGFHVMRYFKGWDFRVGSFELTLFGSLLAGILLLTLAASCFLNSK